MYKNDLDKKRKFSWIQIGIAKLWWKIDENQSLAEDFDGIKK